MGDRFVYVAYSTLIMDRRYPLLTVRWVVESHLAGHATNSPSKYSFFKFLEENDIDYVIGYRLDHFTMMDGKKTICLRVLVEVDEIYVSHYALEYDLGRVYRDYSTHKLSTEIK